MRWSFAVLPFAVLACTPFKADEQGAVLTPAADAGATPDAAASVPPAPVEAGSPLSAPMIAITDGFSIDKHEVTVGEWAAFQSGVGTRPPMMPTACKYKVDSGFALESTCETATGSPSLPQGCLDWCDAYAYCAWAGKRLCGAIDRATAIEDFNAVDQPKVDEWTRACSGSETTSAVYPYGPNQDPTACHTGAGITSPVPPGTRTKCVTPLGVADMGGNMLEWEDVCIDDDCLVRGGSFKESASASRCDWRRVGSRSAASIDSGARCCKGP